MWLLTGKRAKYVYNGILNIWAIYRQYVRMQDSIPAKLKNTRKYAFFRLIFQLDCLNSVNCHLSSQIVNRRLQNLDTEIQIFKIQLRLILASLSFFPFFFILLFALFMYCAK